MTIKQKFKGKEITETKVVNNLLRYYNIAQQEDIEAGKNWYTEANEFCKELSERYGLEVWKVAGIVSALSPQTSWEINKVFAEQFIQGRGRGFMGNRDRTIKAKNIYKSSTADQVNDMLATRPFGALKTKAFFRNIILPNFCDTVTIDRHAVAAAIQRPDNTRALSDREADITPRQYSFLASCYVKAAKKVGLVPSTMQAIIWLAYRKQRGLSKPAVVEGGFVPVDIEDF